MMKFNRLEVKLLALSVFVYFCLITDYMVLMPLGAKVIERFGIAASDFSFLVTIYSLAAAVGSIVTGIVCARWVPFDVIILGLLGVFLGDAAVGFSHGYGELLWGRGFVGFSVGVLGAGLFSLVGTSFSVEKRGAAVGILMSAFAIASIVGVPLGLVLSGKFDWGTPFLTLSGLSLVLVVFVFSLRKRWTRNSAPIPVPNSSHSLFDVLPPEQWGWVLGFLVFLILGHFSLMPFLFPSIVMNRGVNESQLIIVYLCGGLASSLASIFFGILCDKIGRVRVFSICLLGSLPVILLVTNNNFAQLTYLSLLISLFFVFMSGRMTPAMTLLTEMVSPESRVRFLGFVNAIQHFSMAAAAFAAGLIVEKREQHLYNLPQLGLFAVACSLLSLLLVRKVRPFEGMRSQARRRI